MLKRLACWFRGGHVWRYLDADHDERECTRCRLLEYAGIVDVDGNKVWFDR